MGLNYSYLFVCRTDRVNELFYALSEMATVETSARLTAALPWEPNKVLQARSVRRDADIELKLDVKRFSPAENCLVLRFPQDDVIAYYLEEDEQPWWQLWKRHAAPPSKRVEVGCIDLTLREGAKWSSCWLTAVTRDIEKSPSIRKTFAVIAADFATMLLLDREDEYEFIVPQGERFDPNYEAFLVNDETYEGDTDLFAEALLSRAGLANR